MLQVSPKKEKFFIFSENCFLSLYRIYCTLYWLMPWSPQRWLKLKSEKRLMVWGLQGRRNTFHSFRSEMSVQTQYFHNNLPHYFPHYVLKTFCTTIWYLGQRFNFFDIVQNALNSGYTWSWIMSKSVCTHGKYLPKRHF